MYFQLAVLYTDLDKRRLVRLATCDSANARKQKYVFLISFFYAYILYIKSFLNKLGSDQHCICMECYAAYANQ